MKEEFKNSILSNAVSHVKKVRGSMQERVAVLKEKTNAKAFTSMFRLSGNDQLVAFKLYEHGKKRIGELAKLIPSPYFVRCEVLFEDKEEFEELYFGKFSYDAEDIYSWTAEAARIRFEEPGDISYVRNDGTTRTGKLLRKDQYMITDGKILFLSSESTEYARELIHQEHFSSQKKDFLLPEIVAQMEKAQDQVIRAHHKGPFVISGPAGSGKTTLALHRVAYLAQSPETSEEYPTHKLLVFVQDTGTKEYFSELLPSLGITEVTITTFFEWAKNILSLGVLDYVNRFGNSEEERDMYEYAKSKTMSEKILPTFGKRSVFALLNDVYSRTLSSTELSLFKKQQKENVVDRFDVTLLLRMFKETNGSFYTIADYYEENSAGVLKKKRGKQEVVYPLIVVDEFQNYIPEQIQLIKSTLDKKKQSIIYVGDLVQQTRFGALQNWNDIEEKIEPERKVVLQKVYRNTKSILTYIQSLGYDVDIAEGVKTGDAVTEAEYQTPEEEITHIKNVIIESGNISIGIIAKHESYLEPFKKEFKNKKNIHVLTMHEAQGVEFEWVFLVGVSNELFEIQDTEEVGKAFVQEKTKINKDLLYVALTRAISRLHVLGSQKLTR